jgi:hypothetical protein
MSSKLGVWIVAAAAALGLAWKTSALSRGLSEPELFFPRGHAPEKAEALVKALKQPGQTFLGGLVSHWEPDWTTTLVYGGGNSELQSMVDALRAVPAVTLKVSVAGDLGKETGSALTAGSWWVVYRHTAPDTIELRLNAAQPAFGKAGPKFLLPPGRPADGQ